MTVSVSFCMQRPTLLHRNVTQSIRSGDLFISYKYEHWKHLAKYAEICIIERIASPQTAPPHTYSVTRSGGLTTPISTFDHALYTFGHASPHPYTFVFLTQWPVNGAIFRDSESELEYFIVHMSTILRLGSSTAKGQQQYKIKIGRLQIKIRKKNK